MAKAQKAAADASAEFIASLNDLQKAANKANFSAPAMAPRKGGRGTAVATGGDVCATYLKVRPFLEIISRMPFIPAKVKQGIGLLMSALDVMCPVGVRKR